MQNIYVSGNLGKTLFSFYLAQLLSKKGKKVIVISPDFEVSPSFSLLFEDSQKSLGKLLEKPFLSPQEVFDQISFAGDSFAYLGYANSETPESYPDIIEKNCDKLLKIISDLADFVIFDSKIKSTLDTAFRSQENVKEIVICSADRRGISYRSKLNSSQKYIQVLNEVNPCNNVSEVSLTYPHRPKYILPYCKAFDCIYSTSKIIGTVPLKAYRNVLKKLLKEEFYC